MATVLSKGSLFAPQLVGDLINRVVGKSALAQLCRQTPVPFLGMKEFTFQMDSEIDIVAENGAKTPASILVAPRTMVPLKVEYGARVSDEFMIAAEEEQLSLLQNFMEGYARKLARGLDLMAFHGVNPRTGTESNLIANDNSFDKAVSQTVTAGSSTTADAQVEAAIAMVQTANYEASGMAMSPTFRSRLAAMTNENGERIYRELAWGNTPGAMNGLPIQSNSTVSANPTVSGQTTTTDLAVVGDFEGAFRWGYSRQIPMRVIEYGDPDNTGSDLQGHNQVYLRCETYVGWSILDPLAFARIVETSET